MVTSQLNTANAGLLRSSGAQSVGGIDERRSVYRALVLDAQGIIIMYEVICFIFLC